MKEYRKIVNRWTGQIIAEGECSSLAELAVASAIRPGDTPKTNQASRLALEWVDQWLANMRAAFGGAA